MGDGPSSSGLAGAVVIEGVVQVVGLERAGRTGEGGPGIGQTTTTDLDGPLVELPLLVGEVDEVQLSVCHVDNYDEGV